MFKMKVLSIDVGEKNFAYSVIEINFEERKLVVNRIVLANAQAEKKKDRCIANTCIALTTLFESDCLAISCDLVVIEQQVRSNARAQKLAQHTWSYFNTKFLNTNKRVITIPASIKTQVLFDNTQPTPTDYRKRKQWSVSTVMTGQLTTNALVHGLEVTIPESVLREISLLKKKDDVCDTIVQAVAYTINYMSKDHR